MALRFFNTMSRAKEAFEPVEAGKAGLYTCGPTIYNFAHIGNFRAYVFEDLLRRYLEYRGYEVRHVMNLTDVEDKLIRACRETGEPLKAITDRYARAFFEDVDTLGIRRADVYPAATDHVPEMVAMIKTLREKGHTYEHEGSIYFRLSTFPRYGRLSHMDLEQLRAGASGRVDTDEYEAADARDFALWKAWDEDDGAVFWETELGKGRPGWHIECSAMSLKYLGESFDIHCGGVDNIFPHHENEIAQSECCTGRTFVKYWLHCAHLVVEGRKMSKSLGNFFTLRDLLERGIDPMAIRWVLLATHYRQPNNFSFEAVDAARESLRRIRDFRDRLKTVRGGGGLAQQCAACEAAFQEALDDDLNISGALGVVFDFIRDVNKLVDDGVAGAEGAREALTLMDRLDRVTGLFGDAPEAAVPQDVLDLVQARQDARRAKDFAKADAVRDQLRSLGWILEDTADGPRVKRA
ncbi:MAG: cysteine--tRNA ligase [Candidatus Hydrogenedentes bacterium]|nr:cysteine--tRNA ligase [Candidatus Hydrogenedentota bacterium]